MNRRELLLSAAAFSVPAALARDAGEPAGKGKLRILILGGTGFIGPAQVRHAQARGHTVTLYNRGRTNPGLFPDVEKGRKLAGVNLPGTGARFYFDGQLLGSIDDPAFARAFFAIWLDERTKAPQLRESLLKTVPIRTAGI
jgi:hypothetical protein